MESIIQYFKNKGMQVDYVLQVDVSLDAFLRSSSAYVTTFNVAASIAGFYETDSGSFGLRTAKRKSGGGWYSASYLKDSRFTWDVPTAMTNCPFTKLESSLSASSSTNTTSVLSGSIKVTMDMAYGGKFYRTTQSGYGSNGSGRMEMTEETRTEDISFNTTGQSAQNQGRTFFYVHVKDD